VDLCLDDTGLQEAQAVARRITAEYRPAAVLSSPLGRARQTAEAIAERLRQVVQPEEALVDMDFGEFTGLSPAEAEARYKEFYQAWLTVPHLIRFPHGESLDDVRSRINALLRRVTEFYPNEQVVCVTHEIVGQLLLCTLLGIHNRHFNLFKVDTASLTVFELNGKPALVTANNTCHLKS
jgi:probable phosphoglycerate mutase